MFAKHIHHIFVSGSAAVVLLAAPDRAVALPYDYATTSGYPVLADTNVNTATASLQGNAITINVGTRGTDITLGTAKQFTFAGEDPLTNLSNPDWVAGTRSFFDVTYNRVINPPAGNNLVTFDILFSQPLAAASYLVFVDFDAREVLNIRAYDTSPTPALIDYNAFTFSRQNGNTPDGALLAYPTWDTLAGYSGSLVTGTFDTKPEAVVSLLTSVAISRLEYEFDMNPTGSITSNDVQFNFATPVPEPSTYALLALAAAGLGIRLAHTKRRN